MNGFIVIIIGFAIILAIAFFAGLIDAINQEIWGERGDDDFHKWSEKLSEKHWYISVTLAIFCFYYLMDTFFWGVGIAALVFGGLLSFMVSFFVYLYAISFIFPLFLVVVFVVIILILDKYIKL